MGFPSSWFEGLTEKCLKNPTTPSLAEPLAESERDTWQDEPLHQPKQRSLLEKSSISTVLLGGKRNLKQRISVERCELKWAQQLVTKHHYLHRPIHPLSIPFAYSISLDDVVVGTIIMVTPHFTKKKGLFGYEGLPTKWQVLQIARLWIDPKYQVKQDNGHASNIASCAIATLSLF